MLYNYLNFIYIPLLKISLLVFFNSMCIYFYFILLIIQHSKEKSFVKSLSPLVVLCTLYWAFCLLYIPRNMKKITRSHHQNGYFLMLPVIIPYPLLNLGISFSLLDKVFYTLFLYVFLPPIHAV